jgi:murein DD-endopeptidase MepM/ murein hydrolase activator NlpD
VTDRSPGILVDYRDRSASPRRLPLWSPWSIGAALAITAVSIFQVASRPGPSPTVAGAPAPVIAPVGAIPGAQSTPAQLQVQPVPIAAALGFESIDIVVRSNDTLDRIFRRLKLSLTDLALIRELPGTRQTLDTLRPGDEIKVTHRDGVLKGLVRQINESQTLSVQRDADGFEAEIIENPVETELMRQRVRIDTSLFEAANASGVSDQTALAIANIFGWDIDFVLDIREGDEFIAVYEKIWQDGVYLRDGEVLAAEFVNDGNVYRAVRYVLPDGHTEYFTPEGRSMHKAFLRAPVEFTRISSRFNPRRRHPILNRIRAHNGVDYAAPTGTPVRAAGEGKIHFRGVQGGYGRAIVIQHGGSISTLYGHLSRFGKNSAVGRRVKQGDVIGYVGQTGLASGPHLHYEYRVNGVHRNPQTVKHAAAKPIAPELRGDFAMHAAPLVAELELTKRTTLLASHP